MRINSTKTTFTSGLGKMPKVTQVQLSKNVQSFIPKNYPYKPTIKHSMIHRAFTKLINLIAKK